MLGAEVTEVRYGIEANLRVDGDERYYVMAYTGHSEHQTKELVTVMGSSLAAERDVRRLRAGETLPYDRRKIRAEVT